MRWPANLTPEWLDVQFYYVARRAHNFSAKAWGSRHFPGTPCAIFDPLFPRISHELQRFTKPHSPPQWEIMHDFSYEVPRISLFLEGGPECKSSGCWYSMFTNISFVVQTRVQAFWRGMKARLLLREQVTLVCKLQAIVRGQRERAYRRVPNDREVYQWRQTYEFYHIPHSKPPSRLVLFWGDKQIYSVFKFWPQRYINATICLKLRPF